MRNAVAFVEVFGAAGLVGDDEMGKVEELRKFEELLEDAQPLKRTEGVGARGWLRARSAFGSSATTATTATTVSCQRRAQECAGFRYIASITRTHGERRDIARSAAGRGHDERHSRARCDLA